MKKVGVLGSGVVGRTLADGFEKRGKDFYLFRNFEEIVFKTYANK